MLIKPIKTCAKSITESASMQLPMQTSMGIGGRLFSIFAKSILDKYTKVLNYQFDYTSLVFLEHVVDEGGNFNRDINNTIMVTWKLLSFLLSHETRQNQFLYETPVVLRQIIQQVEQNLSLIKLNNQNIYQDMMRCYSIYEQQMKPVFFNTKTDGKQFANKIVTTENGETSYYEMVDYIEGQINLYEEKQQTEALIKKEKTKTEPFLAPFIMSRSFFVNLNHLMNDNKAVTYKQIWQQSVSQQLEQYYLDLHMQKFIKEQDVIKKEEMVFNLFQEFGSEKIQKYLDRADETLYEQFVQVMYTLAGSNDTSLEQNYYITTNKNQTEHGETRKEQKKYSEQLRINKDTRENKELEDTKVEDYSFSHQTLLFAEYKQKENIIMDLLENSEEITKNILLCKVEEYKELFYEYGRSIIEHQEPEQKETEQQNEEQDNPEIFTDYELKVMLDVVAGKNSVEQKEFLEQKLNLFAMKEITERLLEEKTNLLQKDCLQLIYKELEPLSFANDSLKEANDEELPNNIESINNTVEIISNTTETERIAHRKLFVKLKNQFGQLQNESIRRIIETKTLSRKEEKKEWEAVKQKSQEFYTYSIKHTFENGTLPERKLLYLALEHTMDQLIIEKQEQSTEKQLLEELIQVKKKIIKEKDAEKTVAGEWRFLMTKQKSSEIIQAVSELKLETRKELEQLLQEKVREFYSELSTKEKIQQTHTIKQVHLETEKASSVEEIQKKIVLAKKVGETTFIKEQKKYYNLIKNMKFSDVVNAFETGSLPERKLMYVALQNTISAIEEKKVEKTKDTKKILSKAHVSQIKEALSYDMKKIKKKNVSQMILFTQEQNQNIMKTLTLLKKPEKECLVENLVQQIQKLLFHKETQLVNMYIKNEKYIKTNEKFEKVDSYENTTKNVNKNLKIRHLYDKIKQKLLLEKDIYEKTTQGASGTSLSYIPSTLQENEIRMFHQMAKKLRKDVSASIENESIQTNLLTQKNKDFMQPPTEEIESVKKGKSLQSVVAEQIKYHEESVKLILNHTKDAKVKDEAEYNSKDELKRENILKELEGDLLDYRMQLEDKDERLEVVEKQLREQKKELQLLSESQTSMSQKNLKPAETREFMKRLKNEMKMEQMRRGKR